MREADDEAVRLGRGRGVVMIWARCPTCTAKLQKDAAPCLS
jgi:hypothetical protein